MEFLFGVSDWTLVFADKEIKLSAVQYEKVKQYSGGDFKIKLCIADFQKELTDRLFDDRIKLLKREVNLYSQDSKRRKLELCYGGCSMKSITTDIKDGEFGSAILEITNMG